MSALKLSITHHLSQEEALLRIKNLMNQVKLDQQGNIQDVQENWEGNAGHFSFSAKGFNLAGKILVGNSGVDIDADLPFALSLFKGQIKSLIEDKARAILDN